MPGGIESIRSRQSLSLALKGSSQSLAAAMLRNHTTSLLVRNRRPGAGVRECVRCFARSLPKAIQLLEEVSDQIAGCSSTVECKVPPGTMSRATEIRRPATKHSTDFPVPIKAQLTSPNRSSPLAQARHAPNALINLSKWIPSLFCTNNTFVYYVDSNYV